MPHLGKKKEGWPGVIVTAVVCGFFLWLWFKPEGVNPALERDPRYWLELAARQLPQRDLPAAFDVLPVVIALEKSDAASAAAVAKDWLAPLGELHPEPPTFAADASAPASVASFLEKAREAVDALDLDGGRALLREAALAAGDDPIARSWVATRQVRTGFATDASDPTPPVGSAPPWLVAEWIAADRVAPALSWLQSHADATDVRALLVTTTRERFHLRDNGPFAADGAAADPLAPHEKRQQIFDAIQSNQPGRARTLAGDDPRLWLVIARALAWLSAPEPPDTP